MRLKATLKSSERLNLLRPQGERQGICGAVFRLERVQFPSTTARLDNNFGMRTRNLAGAANLAFLVLVLPTCLRAAAQTPIHSSPNAVPQAVEPSHAPAHAVAPHRHVRAPSQVAAIPASEQVLSCTILDSTELVCADNNTYIKDSRDDPLGFAFWLHLGIVGALVLFAGT